MKRTGVIGLLLLAMFLAPAVSPAPALALQVPLTFVDAGFVGGTKIYRASLTGITDLTQVGAITIIDDGTPVGGSPGIFSGFDLDMVFLDGDGDPATGGDRFFASNFLFTAGTTRPTADPTMLPNAAHPGPTFGSANATTIQLATATLNAIDGVAVADVNVANGFLTLGDGGKLIANFLPNVPVGASLFLLVGEVGGQVGEELGASVFVSDVIVPLPGTALLLGSGILPLLGLARRLRSKNKQ